VRRASGLVLVLTGLAATTYVSLQTDTDEVPSYRLQHVETRPNGIASAGETTEPLPTLPVPVVVTIAQPQIRPALPPKPRTLIPTGRAAIGRQLQRELKRVGCYDGNLNGEWTRPTRQAMNAFIDRVNAKLPTNVPDGVLLALVQACPTSSSRGPKAQRVYRSLNLPPLVGRHRRSSVGRQQRRGQLCYRRQKRLRPRTKWRSPAHHHLPWRRQCQRPHAQRRSANHNTPSIKAVGLAICSDSRIS
jgi:hypothetical protein